MTKANGAKPQHFSADEKLTILEEARLPGATVAEVLRRYQLEGTTFYRWERDAKAAMREALGGKPRSRDAALREKDREITRLQAELEKKRQVISEVVEDNLALAGCPASQGDRLRGALKVREATRFSADVKRELLALVARTQTRTGWTVRRILHRLGLSKARYRAWTARAGQDALADRSTRAPLLDGILAVEWDLDQIEKGGFEHFMLKEIFEQATTIENTMRGRLVTEEGFSKLGGMNISREELQQIDNIIITACGTSWHSGLIGELMIEEFARIRCETEYASEFRYRNPIVTPNTLCVVISQSGETADTLAAMREAKQRGARTLGFVNVVGSTIAREDDGGVYLHAGPEIGVASTKAFTSQVIGLALLMLKLARRRDMSAAKGREVAQAMEQLPAQVQQILDTAPTIEAIAEQFKDAANFLYLGRGYNFPVALEGALKLKEISYIHAEGYPAAEMKHGPIALIDEAMPVVFIAPHDSVFEKIVSNIQEVKARGGRTIVITSREEPSLTGLIDHEIRIPETVECLYPILTVVPLQLLSYYVAAKRGLDVDQPRNLAKSVTVE